MVTSQALYLGLLVLLSAERIHELRLSRRNAIWAFANGGVEVGKGQFRLTPVRLGPDMDGKRAVLSGLKPEQPILVEGAFHLNNERKRKELE